MVISDIPKHYTASPSSFSGTPHLTINRDATFDLDSSNAFEGPEKLLEVWFAPSADALPASAGPDGLKSVSATIWTEMLDLVHCKILSMIESEQVDAYLLSESSMFVFPHKLVLKTCGITTLLCGIPRMLEIAALSAGFPHRPAHVEKSIPAAATPYRVFYSRKNFHYPEQQRGPHRSWRDEVRALDSLFQRGSAYMIGKMNGEHWYLYITEPETRLTPPSTPEHERVDFPETETRKLELSEQLAALTVNGLRADVGQDETLEILMTDLDEANAKQFYLDHASAVAENRYYEDLNKARKRMKSALGSIDEDSEDDTDALKSVESLNDTEDSEYDVFEQTSSDHGGIPKEVVPEELKTEGHALGSIVSTTSGLAEVYPKSEYPDAHVDAYLFDPCGFSANGVIPSLPLPNTNSDNIGQVPRTNYFTVHVTPEPQCSYASFETNVPARESGRTCSEVIDRVVKIFRPGRFSVTHFETKPAGAPNGIPEKAGSMDFVKGYRRVDRIVHDLDGYDLVFRYFERHDWKGGAPRLGEVF